MVMASSCGWGSRVTSSLWVLLVIGGELVELWVLGGLGVEDIMAFVLGEMGESIFSCERVFLEGANSSCMLVDGSWDVRLGICSF